MGFLGLLITLVSLAAFVSFVWLVRNAFKIHLGWGFAVLLLSPIAAIIFTIKYWQESKKPFLIYAGCCAASLVIAVAMFSQLGGFEMMRVASRMESGEFTQDDANQFIESQMDRMENSGMLDAQEQKDLRKMRQVFEEIQQDAAEPAAEEPVPHDRPRFEGETAAPAPDGSQFAVRSHAPSKASTIVAASEPFDPDPAPPGYRRLAVRDAKNFLGEVMRVVSKDGVEFRGRLVGTGPGTLMVEKYLRAGTFAVEFKTRDIQTLQMRFQ